MCWHALLHAEDALASSGGFGLFYRLSVQNLSLRFDSSSFSFLPLPLSQVSSDRKLSNISSRVAGAKFVFFVAGSTITVREGGMSPDSLSLQNPTQWIFGPGLANRDSFRRPQLKMSGSRSVALLTLPKATHSALFAALLECLKPPLKKTSEIYMTV